MAPSKDEFDCKAWAYFSDVDLVSTVRKEMVFAVSAEKVGIYPTHNGKFKQGTWHHVCVLEISLWNPLKRMNCTLGRREWGGVA